MAYTGFAVLGAGLAALGAIAVAALGDAAMVQVAMFSILGGVATLLRSWIMNEMVAAKRLRAVNAINAGSILVSLAVLLFLIPNDPPAPAAVIAVSAIALQPVAFAAMALVSGAALRPRALRFSPFLGRIVLRAGLSLFAAGLALQLIPLIERAYVTHALGFEALGRLYLAFLFVTLFQMVPNLIQQVFLAPVVEKWRAHDTAAIRRELRHFLWSILAYCAAAALALAFLAEPLVALVLPQYLADLRWVYLIAPGLIVFALSAPFTLSSNVVIDYRWYLIAYISGAGLTAFVFAVALASGSALDLDQIAGLRSAVFAAMGAVLMFGSWRVNRRSPEFRLFASAPRPV